MLYGTFIAVITGFYVGCVGVVKEQGYNNDSVYAEITCKVGPSRKDVLHETFLTNQVKKISYNEYYIGTH